MERAGSLGFCLLAHIFEYNVINCNDYLLWHILGFDVMILSRTSRSQNSMLEKKKKKNKR